MCPFKVKQKHTYNRCVRDNLLDDYYSWLEKQCRSQYLAETGKEYNINPEDYRQWKLDNIWEPAVND